MVVQIEQLPRQPIVIFSFSGALNVELAHEAERNATELIESLGSYYAVIDLREVQNMDLIEIINLLETQDIPSWITDTRISVALVSNTVIKPETSIAYPVFQSMDRALQYLVSQITDH